MRNYVINHNESHMYTDIYYAEYTAQTCNYTAMHVYSRSMKVGVVIHVVVQ